jgi:8-oxo-dGTP pyrophosphatase MutT (NUDIX family)
MTGYVRSPTDPSDLRIWVPCRSPIKAINPDMLDNNIGGKLRAGESPLDCIVREAREGLCLDEAYVRARIVSCGTITSHPCRVDEDLLPRGGSEYHRQTQYVFKLGMNPDVVPRVGDGEVADVTPMPVSELRRRIARNEFKLNTVPDVHCVFRPARHHHRRE